MSSKYQREVEHRLSVLQAQSTRWKELFPGRTDDDEEELAWLKEQLQEQISSVEDALKKLKGAGDLSTVATQTFISKVEKELRTASQICGGPEKSKSSYRSFGVTNSTLDGHGSVRQSKSRDYFAEGERQMQQELLRSQDDQLDGLSQTVRRLGEIGLTISEELKTQDRIIEDINEGVEQTSTRLETVTRKVQKLLKNQGKGRLCCVLWLVVALIILVAVFFSL
uniref:t-SNARE coiled-coil homology domain-containing protein n=1 Tax=Palpitomonas bilix TaxID=652834 RepID=A0A7S3G8Y0_9EUKA|mmetsp:Transcript_36479/g.94773  ORF Transcript_36479/g.94773 Transcript_36479/m.94773 type:complete len:224 (+) Transcript_36479:219-890(+)|eukprot:CAMPEP_0113886890 /NCGR_PEP_ID=MMETSP0780_2-20120614/11849_1 /TAXON_ID=652834 /ORGANISM="Palpitomonas bilix" /LENGTH=223 /DNA_ID=CAMNT_0000875241 /DNA_START=118 /DNA_END=789 /DNA_ORIENTATION=+ /assembly_acc=CAM_ASM_000599